MPRKNFEKHRKFTEKVLTTHHKSGNLSLSGEHRKNTEIKQRGNRMMKAKALRCEIFKPRSGDCSNGGISSRFSDVLILCEDGYIDVDLDNPPENLCVYVKRIIMREEHDYVRPYAEPTGAGWMSGGTIIWTCDSRFPGNHPVCFHDRQETWEEYETYSR